MKNHVTPPSVKTPLLVRPVQMRGASTPPPTGVNVFAKFVQKRINMQAPPKQITRKLYSPGTIGARIWAAAEALQSGTPQTPITAEALRIALPDVKAGSVSAGLSQWRKYYNMRPK